MVRPRFVDVVNRDIDAGDRCAVDISMGPTQSLTFESFQEMYKRRSGTGMTKKPHRRK